MRRKILAVLISFSILTSPSAVFAKQVNAGGTGTVLSRTERIGGFVKKDGRLQYKMENEDLLVSLKKGMTGEKRAETAAVMPRFSLVEEKKLPAVRNQGKSDNCWAYGAIASMESNLIYTGRAGTGIDLSETHLTWFTYKGANAREKSAYAGKDSFLLMRTNSPYKEGGNRWLSTATLSRWYGAVKADRIHHDKALSSGIRTISDYRIKNVEFLPEPDTSEGRAAIKQYLMTKGAVDASYYDADCYYREIDGKTTYYCGADKTVNHEIAIVGWDDSVSTAGGKGAWIARNSWGSTWGDGGYFYLSYKDKSLSEPTFFEAEKKNREFSSIYQYDGVGTGDASFASRKRISVANRYTARRDEQIQAVGTYTTAANSVVKVEIYVNSGTSPVSGVKKFSRSFQVPYGGFHTLELGTTVGIPKGYAFSIIVTTAYTDKGKRLYFLPAETEDVNYYLAANIDFEKRQSYVNQGKGWKDVTKLEPISEGKSLYEVGNALAKAYGIAAGSTSQKVSVKRKYVKTMGQRSFLLNAKRTKGTGALCYKSGNPDVAKVTSTGRVRLKGPGRTVITVAAAPDSIYRSAAKKVEIIVKPRKVRGLSVTSKRCGEIGVKWKRQPKAGGYRIAISTKKNFDKSVKRIMVTKGTSNTKTVKNLQCGKTYYVKVRAYKKSAGKTVLGACGRVKEIRVK